jgi:hypothetical protein
MAPRIGSEVHWFAEHGLYDGLFLMKDEETGTYWDHMTGRAVYGPLVGESLDVSNLRQTTVEQVLAAAPDALITLSDRGIRSNDDLKVEGLLAGIRGRPDPHVQLDDRPRGRTQAHDGPRHRHLGG